MSVYGIDMGTSFVKLARLEGDKCEAVSLSNTICVLGSDKLLVSAVYLLEDGEFAVGQTAYNMRRLEPERYAGEFKRRFGQSAPYTLAGRTFTVESLYVEVFRRLRAVVQEKGWEAGDVVLTYPATYTQDKIDLLRHAANTAGLWHVTLLDEPAAAAACYAREQSAQVGEKQLVYDFGGGTFDVSLVEKTAGGVRHLCRSKGLANCGGSDFDRAIFEDIKQKLLANPDVDGERAMRDHAFQLQLFETAVKIKHQISDVNLYTERISVGFDSFCYTLTKDEFNRLIEPYVAKTIATCKEIVAEAGLKDEDIARILPVGGTCSIPYIRATLKRSFPNAEVATLSEPSFMVCRGAALSAGVTRWEKNKKQPVAMPTITKPKPETKPKQAPKHEIKLVQASKLGTMPEQAPKPTDNDNQSVTNTMWPAVIKSAEMPEKYREDPFSLILANFEDDTSVWMMLHDIYESYEERYIPVSAVAISENSYYLAFARVHSGLVSIYYYINNEKQCHLLQCHTRSVKHIAISYNGTTMITNANDNRVKIWNACTGRYENYLAGNGPLAITADGRRALYHIDDNTLALSDTASLECKRTYKGKGPVALSRDGSVVVCGSDGNAFYVYDAMTGECIRCLVGEDSVTSIALSGNGKIAVVVEGKSVLSAWDIYSSKNLYRLDMHSPITSVVISRDGTHIAMGTMDKKVQIRNAQTGLLVTELKENSESIDKSPLLVAMM